MLLLVCCMACIASVLAAAPVSAADPIELGTNIVSGIASGGDVQQFSFNASRNDIVYFSIGSTEFTSGDPEIVLFSPSMTELARAWGGLKAEMFYTLPVTGTYTVLIDDHYHQNNFYYIFFLQCVNNPVNAPTIGTGNYPNINIGPRGEMNDYVIEGRKGGSVLIQIGTAQYDNSAPEIMLFAPNGTQMVRKYGLTSVEETFLFPETGRYTLLVGDWERANSMRYSMYILQADGPPDRPVANFTAEPRTGAAPCSVHFTDLSTNEPSDWEWNFGDGTTSIEQSPVHNYTSAGTYNVTLTAINEGGSDMLERLSYIQILPEQTPIRPLGGSGLPPTDLNGDGLYEDCNGNGRSDFADVVLFFNNMEWVSLNAPVAAFDFNHNERIDFADVVALFNSL